MSGQKRKCIVLTASEDALLHSVFSCAMQPGDGAPRGDSVAAARDDGRLARLAAVVGAGRVINLVDAHLALTPVETDAARLAAASWLASSDRDPDMQRARDALRRVLLKIEAASCPE